MIPLRLRISGFLSYYEAAELDFTTFDLACIAGSNGAGKSSLLDAMTWALFGEARRRDDSVINHFSKTAQVTFDFQYENLVYRIIRAKPRDKATSLEFQVRDPEMKWKPLTEHSLRETEDLIRRTLRMDYETFTNASFFLQGRADQFAQQRPGDRKRILSSILGLEKWETYRAAAVERTKQANIELAGLDAQLKELQDELNDEDRRRAYLQDLETRLGQAAEVRQARHSTLDSVRQQANSVSEQRRLVEVMRGQAAAARLRSEQRGAQLAARQQEQTRLRERVARAGEVEAAYAAWQAARAELERWESLAANFHQHESRRNKPLLEIESTRSRLEQERKTLEDAQAQIHALETGLPALHQQQSVSRQALEQTRTQLDTLAALQARQGSFQQVRADRKSENAALKREMDELKDRIDRLAEATGVNCPLCGQPLNENDRAALLESLTVQGKEKGQKWRENNDWLKNADQEFADLENQIAALRNLEPQLRQQERQSDQLGLQIKANEEKLAAWREKDQPRLAELRETLSSQSFAAEAQAELALINADLKELGYDAAAHDRIRQKEQAGRSSEEALRQLSAARAALDPLEREINELAGQLAAEDQEAARLEGEFDTADQKLQSSAAQLPDINRLESELYQAQETENRLRSQIGGTRQQMEVLANLKVRQADLKDQRQALTRRIAQLKQLERAFSKDGVPALLIEQALPEIEAQANEILDRLSSGAMSVRFSTQKDYKDAKREDKKETLDILISDSAGMREYELFSGGEAFRINFAIRLALSRVLAQRAGARLQTLVIDEGFGSQDADGRQRLIEAINQVRPDFEKIIVITHLEELKDAFPARIEIEKTPEGSKVRVLA